MLPGCRQRRFLSVKDNRRRMFSGLLPQPFSDPVKKTLILSAVTGEVERGGPWSSAAIIGKVLADASNRSIDTIAFDTNAGDAVRPPGLLHGVTPVAGAATGVDAVFEDRATLAGAIGDAGIRCDPAFRHPGRQQPDKIHVADRHHQHQGPG